ncbi:hypothetical protein MF1_02270 [Bartonella quintana]|nr:hypothetical protein MF1_02270 [Bartonella quintana]
MPLTEEPNDKDSLIFLLPKNNWSKLSEVKWLNGNQLKKILQENHHFKNIKEKAWRLHNQ